MTHFYEIISQNSSVKSGSQEGLDSYVKDRIPNVIRFSMLVNITRSSNEIKYIQQISNFD
jgi:hypothetical protein